MDYLHSEFDLEAGDIMIVELEGKANVLLMDGSNFTDYKNGRPYHYFGGFAEKTPVRLPVPRNGHWHLVVDLGGYPGRVKAGVRVQKSEQGATV